MANTLTGLILRIPNGAPLTDAQGDNNLTLITNFVNGLSNIIAASLTPSGSLNTGALNSISQMANIPVFADTLAENETLLTGAFASNNYTVTNPNITAITLGTRISFLAGAANTGATTVTFTNGTTPLTAVPLTKGVNTALAAGDIAANSVVHAIYDGTEFQLLAVLIPPATIAQVQAGTDAIHPVTAAVLGAQLGVAQAWAQFSWSGSAIVIQDSYNVSGIVRNSTGNYTITFTTPFSNTYYVRQVGAQSANDTLGMIAFVSTAALSSTACTVITQQPNNSGVGNAVADPAAVWFSATGRLS
jgi:hypothetical protein